LRIVSGDLLRATERGGNGNIYNLTIQGGMVSIDYGVDTGIIPYAAIHEYGGNAGRGLKTRIPARPYLRPAFDAFEREEWPQVIRRIDNRIRSLF
jgi:phage gpG-like protein